MCCSSTIHYGRAGRPARAGHRRGRHRRHRHRQQEHPHGRAGSVDTHIAHACLSRHSTCTSLTRDFLSVCCLQSVTPAQRAHHLQQQRHTAMSSSSDSQLELEAPPATCSPALATWSVTHDCAVSVSVCVVRDNDSSSDSHSQTALTAPATAAASATRQRVEHLPNRLPTADMRATAARVADSNCVLCCVASAACRR